LVEDAPNVVFQATKALTPPLEAGGFAWLFWSLICCCTSAGTVGFGFTDVEVVAALAGFTPAKTATIANIAVKAANLLPIELLLLRRVRQYSSCCASTLCDRI